MEFQSRTHNMFLNMWVYMCAIVRGCLVLCSLKRLHYQSLKSRWWGWSFRATACSPGNTLAGAPYCYTECTVYGVYVSVCLLYHNFHSNFFIYVNCDTKIIINIYTERIMQNTNEFTLPPSIPYIKVKLKSSFWPHTTRTASINPSLKGCQEGLPCHKYLFPTF